MKFGKQLEEYEQPEWRGHYINYKQFKERLLDSGKKDLKGRSPSKVEPASPRTPLLTRGEAAKDDPEQQERWRADLRAEALRVGEFVNRGLEGLEAQIGDLDKMSQALVKKRDNQEKKLTPQDSKKRKNHDSDDEAETEEFLELRVLEALGLVAEGGRRLRGFAELNHAALYKILKKHDKVWGTKIGLSELLPKLVEETRLGDLSRFDSLDEELRRLSLLSSQTEGLNASAEVARLAAGLGKSRASGPGALTRQAEIVLSFFLGSSMSLFLCIGVLLMLPEEYPDTFSTAYFLTSMPVFRVVFSILLALWCMGAVARTCDKFDINYMFILNVDPRCRVTPQYFFSRAAALTTLWILIFGMYVVDYKWEILPPIWSKDGFNRRSSVHFVFYPLALLIVTFCGMAWPSRICRTRYKISVMNALWRTVCAPFHQVDFLDNIVGDVLTSLAKPLQDVPAAVCYLMTHHPQTVDEVQQFVLMGDTCPRSTHLIVLPIISGLPYLFRAMQCVRRYQDTGEFRNLWNFGKYLASLSVVIVSSLDRQSLAAIMTVSLIATVYAGMWDIRLDWGLSLRDLFSLTKSEDPESQGRHFPRRTYLCCAVFDLAARSTWVLTLMPIGVISHNIVGRVILVSVISSIEIIRRSVWAVIRIENEQVANASGFRALLWVPTKLHEPTIVREPSEDGN
mmetsp:Transcript_54553/g.119368  ORF Transcript_54553/g.119368 Transcript_54553/m.119368 type:complete len:681 (-) Transcript_54553:592-2634(-)|eukprot:CAMPEP_0206528334 /NCGR_PEP_ID=MMETSP0325_2-20121206/1907_1 /ASSEMBLY_ACC=CAM_ASM_000347 /TAXON_ID=2866 /ORGANISM="Crypthecodinium cohnii, Strain Seligo" /LENGTH=680 /DNA_ID=CAMNT_0054023965 /DNA_START=147 /DNA_END=2189 /DNA_ORIENTATION=-